MSVPTHTCMLFSPGSLPRFSSSVVVVVVVAADVVITRTAVGVFNCQQTKPKSGRSYMADQPLEECWIPNGLQARLLLPAACVLAFYCIGFPMLIFIIYSCNKKKIAVDQMLRAKGTGNSRATNPHYLFRKSVGKLYFMFKPKYYWWIQPLLAKKFLLIAISAFLRDNPSMQMAISLILIFFAFAAHVHVLPYMGPKEKMEIVAQKTTKEILKVSARLNMIELASEMDGNVDEAEHEAMNVVRHHLDDLNKELKNEKKILGKHHHEFYNFNRLEETMLASGILVTLTGVMFTSPFLLDEENRSVQRVVTYTVIVVIGCTLIYWVTFFIREICIAKFQKSQRSKLKWASLKGGKSKRNLLAHVKKEKKNKLFNGPGATGLLKKESPAPFASEDDENDDDWGSGAWSKDPSTSKTKVSPVNTGSITQWGKDTIDEDSDGDEIMPSSEEDQDEGSTEVNSAASDSKTMGSEKVKNNPESETSNYSFVGVSETSTPNLVREPPTKTPTKE